MVADSGVRSPLLWTVRVCCGVISSGSIFDLTVEEVFTSESFGSSGRSSDPDVLCSSWDLSASGRYEMKESTSERGVEGPDVVEFPSIPAKSFGSRLAGVQTKSGVELAALADVIDRVPKLETEF